MEINDFIVNEVYTNDQLEQAFKHSKMSGMRYSTTTNTLVLISKNTKTNLYKDKWIDNTLHYTGMGKNGDQLLTSQNRRLANSNEDSNLKVYLFEVFNEKEMTFAGQVYLSEPYYMDEEFDEKGNLRKVYKFPIKTIYDNYAPSSTNILRNEEIIEKIVKKETHISPSVIDKKKLKEKALSQSKENAKRHIVRKVSTQVYNRDPYIREYVKSLANGICQLCEQPAPFELDGEPFLHVHHIEYLANGGHDTIENSIAICPNCHYRVHKLELVEDKDKLKNKAKINIMKIK